MSLFEWLFVGHLIGDFLMQSDNMARHKMESWSWMLRHICTYMAIMTVVVVIYASSHPLPAWLIVAALAFILVTHVILDRRVFTEWWMRLVGVAPNHPWMPIVVDQVFHVLILAIVAHVLVLAGG